MLKKLHRYTRHSARYLWRMSVLGLVIAAILLTFFRAMMPWLNAHKGEVEQQLSSLLGEKVTIQEMETSWYWFQPILKLNHVLVSENEIPLLQLNQLLVGVDLWQSLFHWQIQPGLMLIDDVQLTLRQTETGWKIDGLRQGEQLPSMTPTSYWPVLRWLMLQQKIKIKHVSGEIYLKDGTLVPIESVTVKAAHRRGRYRINGKIRLGNAVSSTEFNLKGDMTYNTNHTEAVNGELFLSGSHVDFEAWKALFSHLPYQLIHGQADTQIWVKLTEGRVEQVQSTLKLRGLEWIKTENSSHGNLDYVDANLAWHPTELGWTLSADHIFLSLDDKSWPENAFMLEYHSSSESYRLFIEKLKLSPALLAVLDMPILTPLTIWKTKGELHDTQIGFTQGHPDFFLSRFEKLSWQGKDSFPSVKNLSGAVYWDPKEGRLELDGEKTEISLPRQAPLMFDTLNLSLDWKQQEDGWQFSLDRFILVHPNLLLSARGLWDGYSEQSSGRMQATAEFSSKEAQKWLPYLPEAYLKPKLAAWLKNDIKRIGEANGRVLLNGQLSDFPFDDKPGDFTITSSLEQVDLIFHEDWQKVTNIDAYLTVDKRVLNADITTGRLAPDVPVKKLNIHVSELGLGQETLLVHGHVEALGNAMLQYVLRSPLQKKLRKLAVLSLQDKLDLDLALAIPLYDSDELSVRGSILFDNNDLIVNLALAPIVLKQVLGTLFFDEHGVSQSLLQANLFDTLLQLQLQTVTQPQPATVIELSSDFDIALLRQTSGLPLLQLVTGHLPIDGLITLVDDAKRWDSIEVHSNLENVAIALPSPFDKKEMLPAPMTVKAAFNFDQGIHLQTSWGKRLNSDIWFHGKQQQFSPARGLVCFNCDEAKASSASGVILEGAVETVDWSAWQKVISTLSSQVDTGMSFQAFQSIHLTIGSLTMLGQTYEGLVFVVNQSKDLWHVLVKEKEDVFANLNYKNSTNTLSGKVKKLVYTSSKEDKTEKKSPLYPHQIPNLDLDVESLYWNQKPLGHLSLHGRSQKNIWRLTEAVLDAKPYLFTLKGSWFKQDLTDKTEVDAILNIRDLAAFLSLWDVPNVITAKEGILTLQGGWLGDFRAFAVNRISGQLALVLRNGRITHFDPETEKKLGLGKLLSILSLQTIPRRLKLDFSDLAYDGYSFDQFEGQFVLKDGVMSTDNSVIDGPVALVSMKGRLDLDKRLYDLDLHVLPHITASLPVVAAIAGGPIAGIATWAASKILTEGVDKVTGYTYTITGPWLEPVVQQVHIYRKKKEV